MDKINDKFPLIRDLSEMRLKYQAEGSVVFIMPDQCNDGKLKYFFYNPQTNTATELYIDELREYISKTVGVVVSGIYRFIDQIAMKLFKSQGSVMTDARAAVIAFQSIYDLINDPPGYDCYVVITGLSDTYPWFGPGLYFYDHAHNCVMPSDSFKPKKE